MHRSNVVAVINSNPDAVEMLTSVCRAAGFAVVAVSAHDLRTGAVDPATFLDTHNPSVVVFDVAPPYGLNWRVLERLRSLPRGRRDRQFVITSVNKRQTEALASGEDRIYEVVGKPYDLDEIAQAVKEAYLTRPLDRPERGTAESPSAESERRQEDRRNDAQMITGRRLEDRRSA